MEALPFDESVPWVAWTPEQARDRIDRVRTSAGKRIRWAVAGGWALDLFRGRTTREHEDLEVVVLNDDVPSVLAAFDGPQWEWKVPTQGWLYPVDSEAYTQTHQTWLWSQADAAFVLDVFRTEHAGSVWICLRDPTLTMDWTEVIAFTKEGVPYLLPQVVLLFKAKHARTKDVDDLHATLPYLDPGQREWLATNLARVHADHPWQELVEASP